MDPIVCVDHYSSPPTQAKTGRCKIKAVIVQQEGKLHIKNMLFKSLLVSCQNCEDKCPKFEGYNDNRGFRVVEMKEKTKDSIVKSPGFSSE